MLKDHQILILMRMHETEKTIGELYELFAEKFPKHSELWRHLSSEEKGHAEAVRKLYQASYEGHSVFEEGNIKVEAVQSIIEHVKNIHDLAMRGQLSAAKALTITYDLENSLLEKTIFTHFKATSQYIDILERLHQETQKHALMTKKEIDSQTQTDTRRNSPETP